MDILVIIGTAIGLSMDALAVSVTNGFIIKQLQFKHAIRVALSFGAFQAIMPVIGWAAGFTFREVIQAYDHWIAFGLLGFIGVKMIIESRQLDRKKETKNCQHLPTLLVLSVATSIDALAVGISFAFLQINIVGPAVIIGCITFSFCLAGIYIGNRSGHFFESKLELIGGIILLAIGTKIALEHIIKHI